MAPVASAVMIVSLAVSTSASTDCESIASSEDTSPQTDSEGDLDTTSPDTGTRDDAGASGDGMPATCTPLAGVVTSLAAGTYCVVGDVIVPAGTTLVIPAGTELVFLGRHHFGRDPALPDTADAVTGGIVAIGTKDRPIVFRGLDATTAWYGLAVANSPVAVQLEWVTIRDAYKDDPSPISRIWRRGGALSSYVNTKGTIIRHSTFVNDRAWMVAGALDINFNGEWPTSGPVEITDSVFEDDSCECGIYVGSADDRCGGGAIRFSHVGGPVTIARNVFRNDRALETAGIPTYGGAIGAFDAQLPLGPGNLFDSNSASAADGAISCAGHPSLGIDFVSVDPTNTFVGNVPDVGCGL